jgi:hypothetical protein
MNAGLSNLATLKAWLLPAAMVAMTDYDPPIKAIGLGVQGQLEQYTNRKFARTVGDIYQTTADRLVVILPRYPIETITSVAIRNDLAEGWQDQGDPNQLLFNIREEAGIIDMGGWLGGRYQRMQFVYTGGYFWEQLEPTDVGYPTAQPAGSTALPNELCLAWKLQCEHIWTQRDKLGLEIGEHPKTRRGVTPNLAAMELLPQVKNLTDHFIRYAMT